MASKSLDEKIMQEEKKLNELKRKKADIDSKIKKSEANLDRYYLMKNNNRFEAIQSATAGTGVSVEDVIAALKSGNMLDLQERMEAAQEAAREQERVEQEMSEEAEETGNEPDGEAM